MKKLLKLVDKFTHSGSNILFTEGGLNMHISNVWDTIDSLTII